MTTGPEVARRFAAALTLLHRREADPVDPAALVGLDLAAALDLQEVRRERHGTLWECCHKDAWHCFIILLRPPNSPDPETSHLSSAVPASARDVPAPSPVTGLSCNEQQSDHRSSRLCTRLADRLCHGTVRIALINELAPDKLSVGFS